MSDYLSRAVERETSAAPAVRPGLPSPFDSVKTTAWITALETGSPIKGKPAENAHRETRAEIASVHNSLAAVNALWTENAAPPASRGKTEVTPSKTSVGLMGTSVTPSPVAISQPESDSSPQRQQPHAATTEPVVRPTTEATPRPPRAAAVEHVVRPATTSPPTETPVAPAFRERAPTARAPRASTELRSETPTAAAPAPPTVARVLHTVAGPHTTVSRLSPASSSLEPARNSRPARNDSSSPRSIHITIGRIEVRAIQPPPEPVARRSAPASPKISLEQYLKNRNGGRS
jgi:hypothetical protein